MRRLILAAASLAALPLLAEVETYNIDPRHTFPTYEVGHLGYSFQRGRFDRPAIQQVPLRASGRGIGLRGGCGHG